MREQEWIVTAVVTTRREYVIKGTRQEAEQLGGKVLQDVELEMTDWDVLEIEENR